MSQLLLLCNVKKVRIAFVNPDDNSNIKTAFKKNQQINKITYLTWIYCSISSFNFILGPSSTATQESHNSQCQTKTQTLRQQ